MRALLRAGTVMLVCAPAVAALAAEPDSSQTKPAETKAAAPEIDPKAQQVLQRMSSYMAGLKNFQVVSESVDEEVLTTGPKLQTLMTSRISVHRPNEIRSEQIGPVANLAAWYDGKSLTLYCKTTNAYGTVPAPPTLDAALDMARKKYGVEAPGADLVYSNAYEGLIDGVKSGQYVGIESIDGAPVHHLAFQEDEVDWQLWVADGPNPLPVRYVITTKTVQGQPQFTARLQNWNTQAVLAPGTFTFHPPPGAKRVDALPTSCPAAKK